MSAQALKGHLDGMLLAALEDGPRHGYAVMEVLRAGLVSTTWSEDGGRRRRMYELTPAGRRTLETERHAWREFSAAVTALLGPLPRPVAG